MSNLDLVDFGARRVRSVGQKQRLVLSKMRLSPAVVEKTCKPAQTVTVMQADTGFQNKIPKKDTRSVVAARFDVQ
jgi:hypothetical protein